jgi:hypothetical protein
MRCVALVWALCSSALGAAAVNAEEPAQPARQERPRDAAQAVQEGSVTQWLEHYQRERGEQWQRTQAAPAVQEERKPDAAERSRIAPNGDR